MKSSIYFKKEELEALEILVEGAIATAKDPNGRYEWPGYEDIEVLEKAHNKIKSEMKYRTYKNK